jgi:hypothetical protein
MKVLIQFYSPVAIKQDDFSYSNQYIKRTHYPKIKTQARKGMGRGVESPETFSRTTVVCSKDISNMQI